MTDPSFLASAVASATAVGCGTTATVILCTEKNDEKNDKDKPSVIVVITEHEYNPFPISRLMCRVHCILCDEKGMCY